MLRMVVYPLWPTQASRGSNKARTKNTLHGCLTYAIMNTLHGCPTYPYYVHCYWVLHIAIRGTVNTDATSVRNVLMGTLHGCPTYLNHEHPTRVPYIYLREYFTWVLYLLSREYPPRVSFLCHHGHPSCVTYFPPEHPIRVRSGVVCFHEHPTRVPYIRSSEHGHARAKQTPYEQKSAPLSVVAHLFIYGCPLRKMPSKYVILSNPGNPS